MCPYVRERTQWGDFAIFDESSLALEELGKEKIITLSEATGRLPVRTKLMHECPLWVESGHSNQCGTARSQWLCKALTVKLSAWVRRRSKPTGEV